MTKCSLTPSMTLVCKIPNDPSKSFVQGKVYVTVNDSVFETSSPWGHAATWLRILKDMEQKILLMYTDGGTDHRNTLESVKLSLIALFKLQDLDMIVAARCAPGHSWTNPAERIMSLLNLGLHNFSLERPSMDETSEYIVKRCGSMKDMREEVNTKDAWYEAISPLQQCLKERFEKLKLKDDQLEVFDSTSCADISKLQDAARSLLPGLQHEGVTMATAVKIDKFMAWKKSHCREHHYLFQVKKCSDQNCCAPPKSANLVWLPDTVIDTTGKHYKDYDGVKGTDTTDGRSSLKEPSKPRKRKQKATTGKTTKENDHRSEADPSHTQLYTSIEDLSYVSSNGIPLTTQTARSVRECVECRKPRLIYSRYKLTERLCNSLAVMLTSYDYTCGAPLFPSDHSMVNQIVVRPQLECCMPIEQQYSSGFGDTDRCVQCGELGGEIKSSLRARYKTVTPICKPCIEAGLTPVVARPYGKA